MGICRCNRDHLSLPSQESVDYNKRFGAPVWAEDTVI